MDAPLLEREIFGVGSITLDYNGPNHPLTLTVDDGLPDAPIVITIPDGAPALEWFAHPYATVCADRDPFPRQTSILCDEEEELDDTTYNPDDHLANA